MRLINLLSLMEKGDMPNVFDLIRENKELKDKLKATKEVAVEHLKKEIELKAHQKEFIEWLKQNIENEEYCYLSQNPSERCRKDVFEEVLSKHKEIVGE